MTETNEIFTCLEKRRYKHDFLENNIEILILIIIEQIHVIQIVI